MKKLILSAAFAALAAGGALAQDTVRIATEGAYPPFNFINDAGKPDGFEVELFTSLCEAAELTCEWVTTDWDSIIPNLQSGNYDAIAAGMSITEERKAVIDFTQAYYPATFSAYAAPSADADLSGVVAAQVNTIQAAHVAETDATLLEFATPDEAVAAVRNGEADAVFADNDFLKPVVDESNGEFVWAGEQIQLGEGIGLGIRKSDTELKAKFDAAIQTVKDDGTLNELLKKWFGADSVTF
ncbi:transporter substrate-binding domain-containing protein [Falsirhodobacter xinxiangensis]|uniref:transporter substrate-binding domain-containing protein n=1 Tax=Falsirhodobacter xinxiangensis TaxID=2530049 RepID=UPI0010AA03BC|nr:transporter substrate-binding domain-containing protein [Rhodobacter xinxiangensis]